MTRVDLRPLSGLWRIWFELGATQQYYPLLHSAFWIEHVLWGDAPLGYHLVNVGLHVLAACLAATFLRRYGAPGSWLAAALFVVHPICVESVAWVSEQKNTLSLVFYLSSALAYQRFDATRRRSAYVRAFGFFALALLTKSVTATLPAALLVILWWRRGKIEWKKDVAPLLPWFGVALASGIVTAIVERKLIGAEGSEFDLTLVQRCLLAGRVLCFYLGKLAAPTHLAFFYFHWDVAAAGLRWLACIAAVLTVTAGLWLLRGRWRAPLAAWLFFAGSLFPALGFFNVYPFRFSYVADHFQYLASLGPIALAAGGLGCWTRGLGRGARAAVWSACSAVLALLAVLTFRQSGTYRDLRTLYTTTIARNPGCWIAHYNFGVVLAYDKEYAEALGHFQEAVRLRPTYAEAIVNWGDTLSQVGRTAEAIACYRDALRLNPNGVEARTNLGLLLSRNGRRAEAIELYEAALKLNPRFAPAHFLLANAYRADGRIAEAIGHYEQALLYDTAYADAAMNLGNVLLQQNRVAEAIERYHQALGYNPNSAEAHNNLGLALARTGRLDEAIAHYQEALRLMPEYPAARANLSRALGQSGR